MSHQETLAEVRGWSNKELRDKLIEKGIRGAAGPITKAIRGVKEKIYIEFILGKDATKELLSPKAKRKAKPAAQKTPPAESTPSSKAAPGVDESEFKRRLQGLLEGPTKLKNKQLIDEIEAHAAEPLNAKQKTRHVLEGRWITLHLDLGEQSPHYAEKTKPSKSSGSASKKSRPKAKKVQRKRKPAEPISDPGLFSSDDEGPAPRPQPQPAVAPTPRPAFSEPEMTEDTEAGDDTEAGVDHVVVLPDHDASGLFSDNEGHASSSRDAQRSQPVQQPAAPHTRAASAPAWPRLVAITCCVAFAGAGISKFMEYKCGSEDGAEVYSAYHQSCVPDCMPGQSKQPAYGGLLVFCEDCSSECWEGCQGTTARDCMECRSYNSSGQCVNVCPHGTAPDEDSMCQREASSEISTWLRKNKLGFLADKFHQEHITVDKIPLLLDDKYMGSLELRDGDRIKLSEAVKTFVDQGTLKAYHESRYKRLKELMDDLDIGLAGFISGSDAQDDTEASDLPPCQFASVDHFELTMKDSPEFKDLNEHLCMSCPWHKLREKGAVDCKKAKSTFRLLSKKYHPDALARAWPSCKGLELRSVATNGMMDATRLINKYCRKRT